MQSSPVQVPIVSRSALKVLIVDDSSAARTNERNVLRSLGFANFTEASDASQAIAAVVREKFDLIVTEYNLPGMDGLGFVNHLRQATGTRSVPIVLVTGETETIVLEAARRLGVVEIFPKDFSAELVRPVMDGLFEQCASFE